jgi:hypothetical protein
LEKGLMKFAHPIFSIGMLLLLNSWMKQPNNMSEIFTIMIVKEVIDVFHIGDYKAEFHY